MSTVCEVKSIGGLAFFSVKCGDHELICGGGEGVGMKPLQLFITSMGCCIGLYVLPFCKRHRITTEGLTITLMWKRSSAQPGDIEVKIHMPTEVPKKLKSAIIRVAEQCFIHKTLIHPPKIKFSLEEP